jgi:hypothetical protein
MGEMRNSCQILVGKPEGKRQLKDLVVDAKIILEWALRKYGGMVWTGFIWLRIGTNGGLLRTR